MNVMRKHRPERHAGAALHIIKVRPRNDRARNVRPPQEGEHLSLERNQAAAAVTVTPQLSRREEQIEVRHRAKWAVQPGQRETGFKQWNVKSGAVVRDDKLESLQQLTERNQHRRLFIEVAN